MENFNSNLSSKLEFRLEYCWLPMPGRRENFTGLLICIICRNLSNNAKAAFIMYPTRGGGGAEDFRGGSQIFRPKKGGI